MLTGMILSASCEFQDRLAEVLVPRSRHCEVATNCYRTLPRVSSEIWMRTCRLALRISKISLRILKESLVWVLPPDLFMRKTAQIFRVVRKIEHIRCPTLPN